MVRTIKNSQSYSIDKNMQIFLVHPRGGKTTSVGLRTGIIISFLLLGLISIGVFFVGAKYGSYAERQFFVTASNGTTMQEALVEQKDTANQLDALALRLGQLQSQLVRLNAIGRRVVKQLDVGQDEFDFSELPAMGGMDNNQTTTTQNYDDLIRQLSELSIGIQDREMQLQTLDHLITKLEVHEETLPAGSPVIDGWQTSTFGWRTDPFHGRRTFHHGVDFAGQQGTDIIAVASGIIIWAGKDGGYGNLVAIDHGDGYVTRYAHNKDLTVVVGDTVNRGQVIAHMGSTGHSTGTHVHFEVVKDGKKINPIKFIRKQS